MNKLSNLLDKAKRAFVAYGANPSELPKAMLELGEAIELTEKLGVGTTTARVCNINVHWKQTRRNGDKSLLMVEAVRFEGDDRDYYNLSIRTLTASPGDYAHDTLLRTYKGKYYIQSSYMMNVGLWYAAGEAVRQLKGVIKRKEGE